MNAVEFAKPVTGNPHPNFVNAVRVEAQEKGLLLLPCGTHANVIRFLSPITITDDVFQEAMDILETSIRAVHSELGAGQ